MSYSPSAVDTSAGGVTEKKGKQHHIMLYPVAGDKYLRFCYTLGFKIPLNHDRKHAYRYKGPACK